MSKVQKHIMDGIVLPKPVNKAYRDRRRRRRMGAITVAISVAIFSVVPPHYVFA